MLNLYTCALFRQIQYVIPVDTVEHTDQPFLKRETSESYIFHIFKGYY